MIYIEPGTVYDKDRPTALYENLFADGTLSGGEAAGFPVENAVTGTTWDYWRTPSATPASIAVTLGGQTPADCCFIDAHDMATVGADFQIERSINGGGSWISVTDWITPDDNSAIMVLFPNESGDLWRINQRNGPASIGVVMLGEKLAFEYGITDPVSFRHGKRVDVMGGNSEGGQFLGQKIRRKGGNTTLDFPWLTSDWVNNQMVAFEDHYNAAKPFGMALRPDYDDQEVAYCWRPDNGSELRPQSQANGRAMSMNMQVDYYVGS